MFPRGEPASVGCAARGAVLLLRGAVGISATRCARRRFDLVMDFHAILKSGLLACASGAPRRASYGPPFGREGLHGCSRTRGRRLAPRRISRFERNRGAGPLSGDPYCAGCRAVPRRCRGAGENLGRAGVGPAPVVRCIRVPAPARRISAGRAAGLCGRDPHAARRRAVVRDRRLGGPRCGASARCGRGSCRQADGAARLAPATGSLAELAALFARAGSTSAQTPDPCTSRRWSERPWCRSSGRRIRWKTQPWSGTPARSVRGAVACSPCRRGCSASLCMRPVTPEAVLGAARELLDGWQARAGRPRWRASVRLIDWAAVEASLASEPREILVRAPNWAGDVVMATPGLRALRAGFPRARIRVASGRGSRPWSPEGPRIDEVIPLRYDQAGLLARLREARCAALAWLRAGTVPPRFVLGRAFDARRGSAQDRGLRAQGPSPAARSGPAAGAGRRRARYVAAGASCARPGRGGRLPIARHGASSSS